MRVADSDKGVGAQDIALGAGWPPNRHCPKNAQVLTQGVFHENKGLS
jgi:hypothetical protein